ncbi:hypothetical protein B0H11DRAFT_1915811 [Mycena galericulata]|nr:hypothetical protein B0H11DRAFT_1915811 [Mycena galericulata]
MALRKSRLANAHPPMKSRYTDPSELEINISTVPEQLPTSYSMANGFGKSKSLTPFSRWSVSCIKGPEPDSYIQQNWKPFNGGFCAISHAIGDAIGAVRIRIDQNCRSNYGGGGGDLLYSRGPNV